ncbi:MAG TPA: hypothetical protein VI489_03530 [Candidatus Brocadiaceae bacterium]
MINTIQDIRPNRITDKKDELYHNRWGRYGLGAWYNIAIHQLWLENTLRNEMFYQNKQWWLKEDVETFLQDESGETRNRIMLTINMIRGLVDTYKGNAIEMVVGANTESISPQSITRKELSLADALFHTELAKKMPQFADTIKEGRPVGNSPQETMQIHENLYVDGLVSSMNDLLTFGSKLNDFEDMLPRLAEQMAFSGLGVTHNFEYSGHQRFEVLQSKDFFWDRNARKYDLSDGSGWGHIDYWSPTQVYETCPDLTEEQRKMIESYDQQMAATGTNVRFINGTRTGIPVPTVCWRDTEPMDYGYVVNEFGDTIFTRVNFKFDNEEKPKYTTENLVEPPNTPEARKLMGGKGKKICKRFPDVIRYVQFIPWQAVPEKGKKMIPDTILKWGLLPYQETNVEEYNTSLPPYKVNCWSYVNGEVHSPVDDAINPQRFINRVMSVIEQQVNNSGGSGPIFDRDAFSNKDEERDTAQAMDAGKPVFVGLKGRGVQNMIGNYDRTIKAGAYGMFNLVDAVKGVIRTSTGNNEAMSGELQGDRQGAKVTELMIQRGSVVQQPFYYALEKIMLQNYQAIATRGKRIYIENQRKLVLAVGDEPARIITLSRDMNLEDFRVFVKRTNSYEMLVESGNEILNDLYLKQIIDKPTYADLYGRATPDRIAIALRKLVKTEMEMGRMQAEAQKETDAKQEELMQAMIQKQDQKEATTMADKNLDQDKKNHAKLEQIVTKAQATAAYNQKT